MEFFVDRNLGRYDFPNYLRAHGLVVHSHDDHFPQDADDEVWIAEVADRGWIILAADKDVLHVPVELAAVMVAGAHFMNLVGGHIKALDLARNFVNTLDKVSAFVAEHSPHTLLRSTAPHHLRRQSGGSRD